MAAFSGLASQSTGLLVPQIPASKFVAIPSLAYCQNPLCKRCCLLSRRRCSLAGLIYSVEVFFAGLFSLACRSKACQYLVVSASSGMGQGYSHIPLLAVFAMSGRMAPTRSLRCRLSYCQQAFISLADYQGQ
jgi:hypothetical protein